MLDRLNNNNICGENNIIYLIIICGENNIIYLITIYGENNI